MTPYKATLTQQASALVYDLRQRINPQYSDQRGTESCERKECADMIDSLLAELAAMRDQEPVAYRFTENRGNGNTEFNYYGLDEVGMAYRDNCLEITALYAAPGAKP